MQHNMMLSPPNLRPVVLPAVETHRTHETKRNVCNSFVTLLRWHVCTVQQKSINETYFCELNCGRIVFFSQRDEQIGYGFAQSQDGLRFAIWKFFGAQNEVDIVDDLVVQHLFTIDLISRADLIQGIKHAKEQIHSQSVDRAAATKSPSEAGLASALHWTHTCRVRKWRRKFQKPYCSWPNCLPGSAYSFASSCAVRRTCGWSIQEPSAEKTSNRRCSWEKHPGASKTHGDRSVREYVFVPARGLKQPWGLKGQDDMVTSHVSTGANESH